MTNKVKKNKRVHFVGIGGVSMSAIARVLLESGTAVSGSDLHDSRVLKELRLLGARISIGHDASHIDGATEVVLSSAITPNNPEVEEAVRLGIPIRHRSELLADMIDANKGIAVAGAHGKTTVTSMIAWVLHYTGHSPTFLIGGDIPKLGGARVGDGPWIVAEADESDGSLVKYRPTLAVVTSVEADHLENFNHSFDQLKASYAQFMGNIKGDGTLIVCADEREALDLSRRTIRRSHAMVTYGFHEQSEYRARELMYDRFQTTFQVERRGQSLGLFSLSIPGKHNVQNALAAVAICDLVGVDTDDLRRELATFKGARRRFEMLSDADDVLIVDDYAHHPSEIKATIQAAKAGWEGRVIAIFQPHRYSRTERLMDRFAAAFDEAEFALITDIYAPPPERPIAGVSGARLVSLVQRRIGTDRAKHVPTLSDAARQAQSIMRPGDIVVTMGAGDIWKVAHMLSGHDGAAIQLA